jgi:phosphatidylserine/phosphatidylglycerophosphate/cardiolipin synthase-like enzyme
MYFNGASCDIFIGQGAGKKLMDELRAARKSIKIISPYLSPSLVKELIESKREKPNLSIELITSDEIEDFKDVSQSNIYKLIIQNRQLDSDAESLRNKWKRIIKVLLFTTLCLAVLEYLSIIFLRDIRLFYGIIPIIILIIVLLIYKSKISGKRIYSYYYSQLFPFKVYLSPYKSTASNSFIHGKVYLIDDSIAYLGSLNFTVSGTTSNYETRIRTVDRNAVSKINEEFFGLFRHSDLPERDIQAWGRSLYKEPIN